LDGLSEHIHGNPESRARDHAIRTELRARYDHVFAIPASNLDDREAMSAHFYRIARVLLDGATAQRLRSEPTWFVEDQA
jgi:hypothetical protein